MKAFTKIQISRRSPSIDHKKNYNNIIGQDEWIVIFSYLQPKELAIASEVCKLWKQLASRKQLWGGPNGLYARRNVVWNCTVRRIMSRPSVVKRGKSLIIEHQQLQERIKDEKRRRQKQEEDEKRRRQRQQRKVSILLWIYETILQCHCCDYRKSIINGVAFPCFCFSLPFLMLSILSLLIIVPLQYEGIITITWIAISIPLLVICTFYCFHSCLILIPWSKSGYKSLGCKSFVYLFINCMTKLIIILGGVSILFTPIAGHQKLAGVLLWSWVKIFTPLLISLLLLSLLSTSCWCSNLFLESFENMSELVEDSTFDTKEFWLHGCSGFGGSSALFFFIALLLTAFKLDDIANLSWTICFVPIWLWIIFAGCFSVRFHPFKSLKIHAIAVSWFGCLFGMILLFSILLYLKFTGVITFGMYYIVIPLYFVLPLMCMMLFVCGLEILMEDWDDD